LKFAHDVMQTPVKTLRAIERVGKVYDYLLNTTHHAFPVNEVRSMNGVTTVTAYSLRVRTD
jgi:hypothetical protein